MRMSKKKARKLADEWYKRTLEEIRNGTTTGNQSVDYEFESNNDYDSDDYDYMSDRDSTINEDDEEDEDEDDSTSYSYGMGWPEAISQMYDTTVKYLSEKELRMEAIERMKQIEADRERKMRYAFYRKHWKAITVLLLMLVAAGVGALHYYELQKHIEVGVSSDELIGTYYNVAEGMLKSNGFTNIQMKCISDLGPSDLDKEGLVSDVAIGGRNSFEKTSRFPYDARIEIIYHNAKSIKVPMSSKEAKKCNYEELLNAFKEAGFISVRIEADYDLATGWLIDAGSVKQVSINGDTSFKESASYRLDAEVIIIYHELTKNKEQSQ